MRVGRRGFLKGTGAAAAGLGIAPILRQAQPPHPGLLVGAHYYVWFPAAFGGGIYLRARLLPTQAPLLGEYSSASPAVAEQHIAWAAAAGVDFFTLDYWPGATERNARIDEAFLAAANVGRIRFCIFYELQALGYDPATGVTVFDGLAVERFLQDMEEIARRYYLHPSYLRVKGRPVIVLYVTRTAVGRFQEAMMNFRRLTERLGFDPFVIGDEIYWTVAKEDGSGFTAVPQHGRIALFDAIGAYNLYDSSQRNHSGYGAESTLLSNARALYERYREDVPRKPIVPLAMPGYNDRAARLESDHYVIPRAWSQGAEEGSFFAEWLRQVALPLVDPRLPMLLVTSWNEWNEDTAIEPTAPAPPTVSDVSPSGRAYTQGFAYSGYGTRYLEILAQSRATWRSSRGAC